MSQLSLSRCQDICFPSGIIEFRDICGACHSNSNVLRRLCFAIGPEEKLFPQKPWVRSRGSTPYRSHLGNPGMKKPCDKLTNDLDRQDWFPAIVHRFHCRSIIHRAPNTRRFQIFRQSNKVITPCQVPALYSSSLSAKLAEAVICSTLLRFRGIRQVSVKGLPI